MATAAQIEANRRNAQKSTGPTTERGKVHVKLNAIKHRMTARTILPVLPQEDPKELEDRTQQAITAIKPRNPLELDLVRRAVRLSGEIDPPSESGRPTGPTGSEWPRSDDPCPCSTAAATTSPPLRSPPAGTATTTAGSSSPTAPGWSARSDWPSTPGTPPSPAAASCRGTRPPAGTEP